MRKPIALLLALTMVLVLAACGYEPPEETTITTKLVIAATEPTQAPTEAAISETVIYDANDIRITFTGTENDQYGTDVKFLVENNSSKDIAFCGDEFNINGITISGNLSIDVPSGKKSNGTLWLDCTELDPAGITDIAFIIGEDAGIYEEMEDYTYYRLYDAPFSIQSPNAEAYAQPIDESGEIIYQQDGITAISQGAYFDDDCLIVQILVKNETDHDISAIADDISVNDYMMSYGQSDFVLANTVCYCKIWIFPEDLASNSITAGDVEDIEFTLEFATEDEDGYNTVFDSTSVSLSVSIG